MSTMVDLYHYSFYKCITCILKTRLVCYVITRDFKYPDSDPVICHYSFYKCITCILKTRLVCYVITRDFKYPDSDPVI